MALFFKQVKPSKMRVDVFRLEFLTMVHKAERMILKAFKSTTGDWEHEVKFESQISLIGGPTALVGTDDEIYGWVSKDIKPYRIPKQGTADLVYQVDYTAKTVPGVIGSVPGGKSGKYTRRKSVPHPGHEGRHFEALIEEAFTPQFKRMAEEAMRTAVKKSGHGV